MSVNNLTVQSVQINGTTLDGVISSSLKFKDGKASIETMGSAGGVGVIRSVDYSKAFSSLEFDIANTDQNSAFISSLWNSNNIGGNTINIIFVNGATWSMFGASLREDPTKTTDKEAKIPLSFDGEPTSIVQARS